MWDFGRNCYKQSDAGVCAVDQDLIRCLCVPDSEIFDIAFSKLCSKEYFLPRDREMYDSKQGLCLNEFREHEVKIS